MKNMRKTLSVVVLSTFLISVLYFGFSQKRDKISGENKIDKKESATENSKVSDLKQTVSEKEEKEAGPDREIALFKKWHEPFGNVLPQSQINKMWSQVKRLPDERQLNPNSYNSWVFYGGPGLNVTSNAGTKYSGRILDVELNSGSSLRIAAATGGLWGYSGNSPYPMSDYVASLVVSTFATKPGDANTIIMGTGEPKNKAGNGIFITANGGATWTASNITPVPDGVYRIRYNPANSSQIYAATTTGFYRSDDGGNNFTQKLNSADATDIIIDPNTANKLFTAIWNDGLYVSNNNGDNWTKITGGGYPQSNVGRTALGTVNSGSGYYLLSSVAKNSDNSMLGVYRSTDDGATWSAITPPTNFLGDQGWYDNIIGGSSSGNGVVLVGGVSQYRSTNNGTSWTLIDDPNDHADHHAITWTSGTNVYVGNDGGLTVSTDAGATWNTSLNTLPITQYVDIAVGGNIGNQYSGIIFGGSQDNGLSGTTDNGNTWNMTSGGDGGGVAIDPFNQNNILANNGVYSDQWTFHMQKSTDFGQNFNEFNNGVDPSTQWYLRTRNNQASPTTWFFNNGGFVYFSDGNANWVKLNTTAFGNNILNLNVAKKTSGGDVIYACLDATSGTILQVYDGGTWYDRSAGLPAGASVRSVSQHPTDNNTAYALMNGLGTTSKVFKTGNRGQSWVDITGDLPNVPMGDLVPNPTDPNRLYLGTELGCYKTTNGGVNWMRWTAGMPPATMVWEMCFVDSTAQNGKFYVVAGTYGRGVYMREVQGDDNPIGIRNINNSIPKAFSLAQNYPNPFNPSTNINYSIPASASVSVKVYDILGKEIATLVNMKQNAGNYSVTFSANNLGSGVYFYRINAGLFTDVKKMILIK